MDPGIEHLTAEARYHRQRYDLYRAKMYSLRPTTHTRLRELQRACEAAEARLEAARSTRRVDGDAREAEPGS
jgi:hypothetical protein